MSENVLAQVDVEQPKTDRLIGRTQAFGLMSAMSSKATAACITELKRNKAHEQMGLSWEEFCGRELAISKTTADRYIKDMELYGETFFALNSICGIGRNTYKLLAGSVQDGALLIEGESVAINRENRQRIIDYAESLRLAAAQAKDDATNAQRRADAAKKKAETMEAQRDAAVEKLKPHWVPEDSTHNELLEIQWRTDDICRRLRKVAGDPELSPDNEARLLGLVRHVGVLVTETAYGILNQKDYSDATDEWRMALDLKDGARDLIKERGQQLINKKKS